MLGYDLKKDWVGLRSSKLPSVSSNEKPIGVWEAAEYPPKCLQYDSCNKNGQISIEIIKTDESIQSSTIKLKLDYLILLFVIFLFFPAPALPFFFLNEEGPRPSSYS